MQIRYIALVECSTLMTPSEFYTAQFYAWESRGRGWFIANQPIHLEAPFMPYYRHGYPERRIDDGKRHTLMSSFLEKLSGNRKSTVQEMPRLDYDTLEPFIYEQDLRPKALHIKVPKDRKVTQEKMKALLIMLSQTTMPVSFEIIGTGKDIIIQFVSHELMSDTIETYLNAYFPSYPVIHNDTYLVDIINTDLYNTVVDFGLRYEFVRPMNMCKNFTMDPLIGVIAILEHLTTHEQAGIQILFQSTINQWTKSIIRSVTMYDESSFFIDAPEAPKLALEKVQSPLFGVTIRAFGQAEEDTQAFSILEKMAFAIVQGSKGAYNELIPLSDTEYDYGMRVDDIFRRESHRLGMLLNADELVSLLHFPSEHIHSKKLFASVRKTKEVPKIAQDKEFILGVNSHNGIDQYVTYDIEDRLKHTHIIGATGTGKSTLIAHLMLQDIEEGLGAVLFDPHGDLVEDIISRVPEHRLQDVVLIDPSDVDYPIGINILDVRSDIEKEVLASDLVAIFKRYSTSWGDQMNAIIANAILAILESKDGGSLHDLRRFLVEKDYRHAVLKTVADPTVLYYWHKEYPILKTNSIGPILTRLNTFLRPRSIRNIVTQKNGIDFVELLNGNKIILLKLSQGLIGIENSFLLGSLILSKLHLAILQRQQQSKRNPIFIYLDEFQHFATPSMKEMISGIRKYNVGLILSHQDLHQLQREDADLLNSVLGNVNTRIVFRVGEPDAKRLQDGFSGFDHADFQNLGRGEAITRIEQPQYDCSLDTISLTEMSEEQISFNREAVVHHCRTRYATDRSIVEKTFFQSYNFDEKSTPQDKDSQIGTAVPEKPDWQKETSKESDKPEEETREYFRRDDTHTYYQALIKKLAEARGYVATVEMLLPDRSGKVDVLLEKEGKSIAVEISNTTDAEWEMHNISKCLNAQYTQVVCFSGDLKQLEKIKKKCMSGIGDFEKYTVFFYTLDQLVTLMDESVKEQPQTDETYMKGYRVNVTYDDITKEEMERKRTSVSDVIRNTLRRKNTKRK